MNPFIIAVWLVGIFGISSNPEPVTDPDLAFVTIESPNNPADDNGCGRVGYIYRITKQAIDNRDYVEFLNSVDPNGNNSKALYNPKMMLSPRGGIIFATNKPAGSKYQVKPGFEGAPVSFVGWADAARYANWLSNGGQKGSSTEVGAYNLRASKGAMVERNSGARYVLPTQDELYKAAFFLPTGRNIQSSDKLYATPSSAGTESVDAGAISLPVQDGIANMLVDPYEVTNAGPDWTVNDQGKPDSFAFAGQRNPMAENENVGFRMVNIGIDGRLADDAGEDVEEYAGAPTLTSTAFSPSFSGGGSGGGSGGSPRVFSPVTLDPPPSS